MRWLLTAAAVVFPASLPAAGLTSPEPLQQAYELILDARFDEAHQRLQHACPPAPPVGCEVLDAVTDYWQILIDQENTSGDARLVAKIDKSIGSAERWVAREPKRAEAWFYNGGAYGTRVLLRGLRAQYLSAARDGNRIHDSLRRAVTLDPALSDAYFGLGLYHYYAAIAPAAARLLRFLLWLPAGDRTGGLREMEQTRSQGLLLRGEADYQLHLIYLWYERQSLRSLDLIDGLRKRYPHNPVFYLRLAAVQGGYLNNHQGALQTYRALADAAREKRIAAPAISEVNARLGIAQELTELCDANRAIEEARTVIALRPSAPYAALARAHYQLGLTYDRIGRRSDAENAYQHALAENPPDDRLELNSKLRALLKRPLIARACR
ncbi:MAG: tetratricopeptide repeat protein [Vicinamibacterales bacterium]|nr:tetratricopeptide repeat protein [Vicinamibacterales bacterium]